MANTQARGNCQHCGREQAVMKSGLMAKHGYTVENGWFQGACTGSNFAPMQQDRDATAAICVEIQGGVDALREQVAKLLSGKAKPKFSYNYKTGKADVPFAEADEYDQKTSVERMIRETNYRAKTGEIMIKFLTETAEQVHGQPLREVEKAAAPELIRVGDKRLCRGLVATCTDNAGARIYYSYTRENGSTFKGWIGARAWRALAKVAG
jgi:hypothetical protein